MSDIVDKKIASGKWPSMQEWFGPIAVEAPVVLTPDERAKKVLDEARLGAISDAAFQNKIADAIKDALEAYKHSLGQDATDPPVDYISPISGLPNKWPE
jgi:hypothetical protein